MVLAVQHLILQYAKESDDAGVAQTGQRPRFHEHVCTRLRQRCAPFYVLLSKGDTLKLDTVWICSIFSNVIDQCPLYLRNSIYITS